jgi:hypothetical protein
VRDSRVQEGQGALRHRRHLGELDKPALISKVAAARASPEQMTERLVCLFHDAAETLRDGQFEVGNARDVLDDAVACVVPDVHAEGEMRLGFHGQVHSTCPGPLLFIPHVVASRSLPRLLRALST